MTRLRSIRHGDSRIRYRVVRSARRKKTVTITIDPGDGVRVLAPLRTPNSEIESIVRKRADWILRKLAEERPKEPQPRQFVTGETLHYLGRELPLLVQLTTDRVTSVRLESDTFRIACPVSLTEEDRAAAIRHALLGWYGERAAELLQASVERWQPGVGPSPTRISIGNQKTRWGSCSSKGSVRFNLRLAMAPQALIDYVTVHELCHLLVANHSTAFWEQVSRVIPDYEERRRRLTELEPMLTL